MYKIISLFLLLFFELSILPFVSYRLLINPQGKVALIYGDYHNTELDEMNEIHVNLLFECIKTAPSSKKITCLTGLLKTISSKVSSITAKTFRDLEAQKETIEDRIEFLHSDPRDARITSYISDFMRTCYQKLSIFLPLNEFGKSAFNEISIEHGSKILISELIGYLQKAHIDMQTWLEQYGDNSSERQSLQKKIDAFETNLNLLQTKISIFTTDRSFQEAVLVLLCLEPIYKSRNIFLELQELVRLTLHEYAVIAYLHTFLIDQRNNAGTLCIISQDQAIALSNVLQELHYTTINEESIFIAGYGRWGKSKITNTKNFHKNIMNAFASFNSIRIAYEDKLFSETMLPYIVECIKENTVISDKPIYEAYKACDTCLNNTGKLSLCSRCKNIYYCSAVCQQRDWPEHKKICRKKE